MGTHILCRTGFCLFVFCRALKDKSYLIQKRGEIEVKGKGIMSTYFLERNLGATEQQIMGLADCQDDGSGLIT